MKDERRKHKRFPVIRDLAEPVELFVQDEHPREVPAVLTNLSVGGMSLVVFAHVTGDTRLKIILNVPGLEGVELNGHVTWEERKGDTTNVGVKFNHVSHDFTKRINLMAEDFQNCELKLSFGLKDVCFRDCTYWPLCGKAVRMK
ncbi:MAG: PilZ domain-containing protein [Elusimicrobia bacterium]|nr:PilZ domain-containing protein [Elusimicrobiota bacterium]